ncbi:AAA family ATPase [Glaciihabitans sp. GrIS 2.15]|uniref:AAA family ATPase n=1 Tax=Glaciihabitans sp. GrIS 2.15 TaxID=3071710 RepID=UPI002E01CF5E|nr:exonuclease SbcC [Glaciihabitans sp. GrIS 2.15]
MKIKRLTIAGFGPYKDVQTVDFERFDADGIFLITGKTGAGKSSILDAICYALYGSVPRYDGTQALLRSDHADLADPTFVELEFSIDGTDYRVNRVPEYERPKARGEGMTKQAHEATLWVRVADSWEGIAAKPVEVAHELARIVSLNKDQFLQVILLAQNRFQEFLLAKNDDRQAVLRTLFGTRRFRDIETQLDERRKAAAAEMKSAEESLTRHARRVADLLELDEAPTRPDEAWLNTGKESLDEQLQTAVTNAARADLEFAQAEAAYSAEVEVRNLQVRRDGAVATLATLAEAGPSIDLDRAALKAAHRAATVWPLALARDAAAETLSHATVEQAAALEKLAKFGDASGKHTPASLATTVKSLTGMLGSLSDTLAEETRLPAIALEVAEHEMSLATAEKELETALLLETTLPAQINDVDKLISSTSLAASKAEEATAQLDRVSAARAASARAEDARRLLGEAKDAEAAASSAHLDAVQRHDTLLQQRHSGFAGELARQLTEGEPCLVCGSVAHPAPAVPAREVVTENIVNAARAAVGDRWGELEERRIAAQDLSTRVTDDEARADGKSVDELDAVLVLATVAVDAAEFAAGELVTITATGARLRAELAAVKSELSALRDGREQVLRLLTEKKTARDTIVDRVSKNSEGFHSVAARVQQLEAHAEAARALSEKVSGVESRRSALNSATTALDAQATDQGFKSAQDAVAARLDDAAAGALESGIRVHDDSVAAATATIEDSALVGIPDELIDVELAATRRAECSDQRDAALSTRGALETRSIDLATVVTAALSELGTSATQRIEFDQLQQLANVVQGNEPNEKRMRLESFVLAAQLEEIVTAANLRLHTMTGGRFALEHDDQLQFRGARSGLSLAIRDEHTGRSRAAQSLSGGEMFLASLALALGLAEVVSNQAGGIRLDTLFVDEGFGSLDSDTLEVAMTTLDSLRAGGRTIGLISHVEAMKEQIPAKLQVSVTDQGHSVIEEGYAAV